jgi:hypothetical protein
VGNCRDAQANLPLGENCAASGIKSGSRIRLIVEKDRESG